MKMRLCLYNTWSDNIVGDCKYHNCGVTCPQMRRKKCLQKQCEHFVKNEEHQVWKQREVMKQKRAARKEKLNMYFVKSYND